MIKKTIFITGAGSGLGKQAAIALAKRGHKVIATTHYEEQISDIMKISRKEGLDLYAFKLDILKEKDRKLVLNYNIDAFIANAAIGDSGSVSEIYIDRVEKVFITNVFANLKLIQLVFRKMLEQEKGGRIIFLSSLAGRIPIPFLSPYCASKAAIDVFAACLRNEAKIMKNAKLEIGIIEPGAYATGFNKENNEKKYKWMKKNSYFCDIVKDIEYYEKNAWDFIEVKPYDSIIRKYIRAVEDKKLRHRYSAPWWQTISIQIGRIFGM